jgi:hypothetical protein
VAIVLNLILPHHDDDVDDLHEEQALMEQMVKEDK